MAQVTKLAEFYAHQEKVNCVTFGRESPQLYASGADDHRIHVWRLGTQAPIQTLIGHQTSVDSVRFSRDDHYIAAGSRGGSLKVWDLAAQRLKSTMAGHRASIRALDFHPFGELFISGSLDTYVKAFDMRKKSCIQTFKAHTGAITAVRHSPDGRWVASADEVGAVKVWDITAGKLMQEFKSFRREPVRALEFHPNEYILACGDGEKAVNFWDLETFDLIATTTRETAISSITFDEEGEVLLAGCNDALRTYTWDPNVVKHDSVEVGWGSVAEVAAVDDELFGVSYSGTVVKVFSVDLAQCHPFVWQNEEQDVLNDSSLQAHPVVLTAAPPTPGRPRVGPEHVFSPRATVTPNPKRSKSRMAGGAESSQTSGPSLVGQDVGKLRSPRFKANPTYKKGKTLEQRMEETHISAPRHVLGAPPSPTPLTATAAHASRPQSAAVPSSSATAAQDQHRGPEGDWVFAANPKIPREGENNQPNPVNHGRYETRPATTPTSSTRQNTRAAVGSDNNFSNGKDGFGKHITFTDLRKQIERRNLQQDNNSNNKSTRPQSAYSNNNNQPSLSSGAVHVSSPSPSLQIITEAADLTQDIPKPLTSPARVFFDDENQQTLPESSNNSVNSGSNSSSRSPAQRPPKVLRSPVQRQPVQSSTAQAPAVAQPPPDLNMNAFLPKGGVAAAAELDEAALREKVLKDHRTMCAILTTRVSQLRVLGSLWSQGNVRKLVSTLIKMNDQAVAVDFLTGAEEMFGHSHMTLDIAQELLPLLKNLLESRFQIYAAVSLRYLIIILRAFTPLVKDTRASCGRRRVRDLAREDRLARCNAIYDCCASLRNLVPPIMEKHEAIAATAREASDLLEVLLSP